jgi:hypothetical protein
MLAKLLYYFAIYPPPHSKCASNSFFGLDPWYKYLPTSDFNSSTCSIISFNILPTSKDPTSDIMFILLAVINDLLRIAGLVALGFIVYGGFQYAASQGSPDKTAKAQNTVTDALIGLAISIAALSIVSLIGSKLSGK